MFNYCIKAEHGAAVCHSDAGGICIKLPYSEKLKYTLMLQQSLKRFAQSSIFTKQSDIHRKNIKNVHKIYLIFFLGRRNYF